MSGRRRHGWGRGGGAYPGLETTDARSSASRPDSGRINVPSGPLPERCRPDTPPRPEPGQRVRGQPQMALQAHERVPSPPGQNERREALPSPDGKSSRDKPEVWYAEHAHPGLDALGGVAGQPATTPQLIPVRVLDVAHARRLIRRQHRTNPANAGGKILEHRARWRCAHRLVTVGWTSAGIDVDRDALILFDLLLVVVLGLLLYSISARDPLAPPGPFDKLQLALVVSALAIDVLVLVEITGRITGYGTTPNKAAALGENLILLANLAWSAWLLLRLVRRHTPFATLERWQTSYLPAYAAWAWIVVLIF